MTHQKSFNRKSSKNLFKNTGFQIRHFFEIENPLALWQWDSVIWRRLMPWSEFEIKSFSKTGNLTDFFIVISNWNCIITVVGDWIRVKRHRLTSGQTLLPVRFDFLSNSSYGPIRCPVKLNILVWTFRGRYADEFLAFSSGNMAVDDKWILVILCWWKFLGFGDRIIDGIPEMLVSEAIVIRK